MGECSATDQQRAGSGLAGGAPAAIEREAAVPRGFGEMPGECGPYHSRASTNRAHLHGRARKLSSTRPRAESKRA